MLITLEETIKLIQEGRILHIAADHSLLSKLPTGNWIGGTTPYFIGEEGGVLTKEKLCVTELDFAEEIKIASYGKYSVFQIVEDCFENGLTIMIMPYGSKVVEKYAKEAPDVEELLMHPTVGWIAGAELGAEDEIRVYDGTSGTASIMGFQARFCWWSNDSASRFLDRAGEMGRVYITYKKSLTLLL